MILVAVYTADGCVGRCDAKCYAAQSPTCDCVCGGANHGAGIHQALANTRAMVDTWLERYATQQGLTTYRADIHEQVYQLTLL